ncbi:MAG TPA: response regulator [Dongiaceae bacterium]|nr:response regulator [Dongiaceae bacterium]
MNGPVKIIMIEDDLGHAKLIERNIRRAGINNEIIRFETGRAALDFILDDGALTPGQEKSFLILLDLNLPDMSGVDILAKLKASDKAHRVPVVVLTTTDDKVEITRCYDLGCSVYITKPLEYEAFANSVRQLGLTFSIMQIPTV